MSAKSFIYQLYHRHPCFSRYIHAHRYTQHYIHTHSGLIYSWASCVIYLEIFLACIINTIYTLIDRTHVDMGKHYVYHHKIRKEMIFIHPRLSKCISIINSGFDKFAKLCASSNILQYQRNTKVVYQYKQNHM